MKNLVISAVLFILVATPAAFATETVLKHCEGWLPAYFVDLVKIQNEASVEYQVNLQGQVENFRSLVQAQKDFDKKCEMVKSWE